ncbi:MAG: hypothetical protein RMI94_07860 [Bryobacterales bacterium]|nr:hypothetical protein [Bryobacteraceae bacterium]MDW8130451.1 hypothetical protein [Bryobacterales bacterium]
MKKSWFSILLILLAGASLLAGAEFWEKKKYPEWTEKEVRKMLNDSPWARPVEIRLDVAGGPRPGGAAGGRRRGGPVAGGAMADASVGTGMGAGEEGGGMGRGGSLPAPDVIPTVTVHVRWRTALPIKQALVRARFGNEAASSPEAAKFLSTQETHHIIEIAGVPAPMLRVKPEELKAGAQLRIKDKPPIQAVDLKGARDENRFNLYFIFPREQQGVPLIVLEDKEVEVVLKAGPLDIRRKFRLKEMIFEGRLEI